MEGKYNKIATKIIEPEHFNNIEVELFVDQARLTQVHGNMRNVIWVGQDVFGKDMCRELALAICSELQSELEKAKELLKECSRFVDSVQAPRTPAILLKQELTTFLEGSVNKTK